MNVIIRPYENQDQNQVVSLILDIQQNEFGVSITIEDQPDLLNINAFYRKGNGNFWCALFEKSIVGTIGLIDIGNGYGTIRKMFVHKNYRGKDWNSAQLLFNMLQEWAQSHEIHSLYLGTIHHMIAAHKFYRRNGFQEILQKSLPLSFPVMTVDNVFFMKILS